MYKISCTDLILEITRRCNMKCLHCLRGDAENVDMTEDIIKNLFAGIKSVSTLTFSGGEPCLAVHVMRWALDVCRDNGINVRQVYIVTNGLEVSDEFITMCRDWDAYCLECQLPSSADDRYVGGYEARRILKNILNNEDGERVGCVVTVSLDVYHDDVPLGNLMRLAAMPHLVLDKAHEEGDDERWILREGRAAFNGIGERDMKSEMPWAYGERGRQIDIESYGDGDIYIEEMYINAEGGILKECNYSYETQEDYILGRIDGPDWTDSFVETYLDEEE